MNLVPASGSFTNMFDLWFFALPHSFWYLVLIMLVFSLVSYKTRQLSASGSAAAFLVGFGITYFLGFGGLTTMLLFFLFAGVLSKFAKIRSKVDVEDIQKKGSRRDGMQVFANGGMALVAAVLYGLSPSMVALVMFASSVAEAASDTFAGEIGILSKGQPVSIITGRKMKKGLSGAVSGLGSLAGLLGALFIAIYWMSNFLPLEGKSLAYASIVAISGFFGCLMDSVLGATVQAHYYDQERDCLTEHPTSNGKKLPLERGFRWIDNDLVNLMSNVIASLLGASLILVVG
ncbi:MAG: DUF92 domain-containing protein [Spirochaetia bacterium]|nr:DUF92 domain-containing protein [Spirochaetia bacterium]